MESAPIAELDCVEGPERAQALLHPMRLELLRRTREPRSASELALELDLPRQRVNYHVRALEAAGFLELASERKRRNLTERLYRRTSQAVALSAELVEPLEPAGPTPRDRWSAARLYSLSARSQRELARTLRAAAAQNKRVATLSIEAALRFESAEQRARFADELSAALQRTLREHAAPFLAEDGQAGEGRPFRLVLGCHPLTAEDEAHEIESQREPTEESES